MPRRVLGGNMFYYVLCFMAGAIIGALAVCMCVVAGDADERIEARCDELIKEIKRGDK